jgi:Bacteriophage abortive infection AbiH
MTSMGDRRLYVIGNGFDLHHGIPSKYGDFREFIEERDSDLLRAVDEYLPAGDDWSRLEQALAEIDVDHVVEDLEQFAPSYGAEDWSDSGHHDFQYEVRRLVECLSIELRQQFGQWIRKVPIPTPATTPCRLQTLDPTAFFLTFNYTPTLQDLYGVPDARILHIHGSANLPDSDLVLGHAWNPQQRPSLNDRSDIAEMDPRLLEVNAIIDSYFSDTFKPSARLVEEHRPFFEQLKDVEQIEVLGHSVSAADQPYYRALLALSGLAAARWRVTRFPESDFQTLPARLLKLGVETSHITTCSWSEV